ncbi:MAG: hypothetical protein A3B37_00030 [Candidatus Sungbacteria bacterium RIFCSPLOWO2_01_FULL_59_16]|uniref:Uncharacterized protein n=1 Tax=Candidatus Sungbacteria bacterium RIFCSPLOWO2_01_FULL_59_16 TaxID=1802280 RepID=A0A1G2LCE4_9BACT|nr:MAG: hypothetical protein A3B37_00030 [Candidatus Sungbacteria bacterium RIFCSPLOWO2_01_FULL_59_16]
MNRQRIIAASPHGSGGFGAFGAIALAAVLVALAGVGYFVYRNYFAPRRFTFPRAITSFEECANAGYPVAESYPRQCHTPDGRTFTEELTDDTGALDISSWKTYRNEKYGFEVRYPEDGDIVEGSSLKNSAIYNFTIRFYREPHKAESGVLIDKALISVSRSLLPLRQDISKGDEKFTTITILSKNTVVVDNVPAEKVLLLTSLDASKAEEFFGEDTTFDFEVRDWVVSLEHDGYFYEISAPAEKQGDEQFLDTLLSTFKFIR